MYAQCRVSRCIFSLFCLPTAGLRILKYTESRLIFQIYNSDKLEARDNGTSAKANNVYQYGHMLLQGIVGFHVTSLKFKIKKISILPRFYFHDALEQLKTNSHTNFRFKRVLGFVIEYA